MAKKSDETRRMTRQVLKSAMAKEAYMSVGIDQRFALLSVLGVNVDWDRLTTEQVQVGIREPKRAGGELTRFMENGFVLAPSSGIVEVPAEKATPPSKPEVRTRTFKIVRSKGPLEAKVKQGFNYADPNLTSKNFEKQVPANSPDEAIAVNFGEYVESDDAVARLDALGLRPGLPGELADTSKSNPDSQEFADCLPMNTLGDSWADPRHGRYVAYLIGRASFRMLFLGIWRVRWDDGWWFLAFRK